MKLINLINQLDTLNDDLIIYQENLKDLNSNIIVSKNKLDGEKYFYLIEVFLAKEIINDYIKTLDYKPTDEQLAKRLYEYAINDA